METIILALVVLLLVVVGASVGVLFGRKPISGSCGGVGAALGEKDYTCPICGDDPNKCESEEGNEDATEKTEVDLGYELPRR